MTITYKTTPQSCLYMYIECESAADHAKVKDKIYEHSEYDTEWTNLMSDFHNKYHCTYSNIEELKGRSTVMFRFEFMNGRQHAQTLITELDKYFDENARSWDYVHFTSITPVKDIK